MTDALSPRHIGKILARIINRTIRLVFKVCRFSCQLLPASIANTIITTLLHFPPHVLGETHEAAHAVDSLLEP